MAPSTRNKLSLRRSSRRKNNLSINTSDEPSRVTPSPSPNDDGEQEDTETATVDPIPAATAVATNDSMKKMTTRRSSRIKSQSQPSDPSPKITPQKKKESSSSSTTIEETESTANNVTPEAVKSTSSRQRERSPYWSRKKTVIQTSSEGRRHIRHVDREMEDNKEADNKEEAVMADDEETNGDTKSSAATTPTVKSPRKRRVKTDSTSAANDDDDDDKGTTKAKKRARTTTSQTSKPKKTNKKKTTLRRATLATKRTKTSSSPARKSVKPIKTKPHPPKLEIQIAPASSSSDDDDEGDGAPDNHGGLPQPAVFTISYAVSGRATCRRCDERIEKNGLRVTHRPLFRGKPGFPVHRHLSCALFSPDITLSSQIDGHYDLTPADLTLLQNRIVESREEAIKETEEMAPDELVPVSFKGEILEEPGGLREDVRMLPFQVEGMSWMVHQECKTEVKGGILADEMGMGKTLQTITTILSNPPLLQHSPPHAKLPPSPPPSLLRENSLWDDALSSYHHELTMRDIPKPHPAPRRAGTLVICPVIALSQWKSEIERFASNLTVGIYHGHDRVKKYPLAILSKYDVVISTYQVIEADMRKMVNPNKVTCPNCGKLFKIDKLRVHLMYFCGEGAKRTAKQMRQRRGRRREEEEDEDRKRRGGKGKKKMMIVLDDDDEEIIAAGKKEKKKSFAKDKKKVATTEDTVKTKKAMPRKRQATKKAMKRRDSGSSSDSSSSDNNDSDDNNMRKQPPTKKSSNKKRAVKPPKKSVIKADSDDDKKKPAASPMRRTSRRAAAVKTKQRLTKALKDDSDNDDDEDDDDPVVTINDEDDDFRSDDASEEDDSSESDDDDLPLAAMRRRQVASSESDESDNSSSSEDSDFETTRKITAQQQKAMERLQHLTNKKNDEKVHKKGKSPTKRTPLKKAPLPDLSPFIAQSRTNARPSPLHTLLWHRIVLDEAHMIKSRNSQTTHAAFALSGIYRWCLTGTPLQNRVGEFYSLIRFLRLGDMARYFCRGKGCDCNSLHYRFLHGKCLDCGHGSVQHYSHFNKYVLNPIQRDGYSGDGRRAMFILKNDVLDKALLRRTKETKAEDMNLPPRLVEIKTVALHPIEEDFYNALYTRTKSSFDDYVADGTLLNNYAHIFDLLIRMRQSVNHPYLVLHTRSKNAAAAATRQNNTTTLNEQQPPTIANGSTLCDLCSETPTNRVLSTCCRSAYCRDCAMEYVTTSAGLGSSTGGGSTPCPSCRQPFSIDFNQVSPEDNDDAEEEEEIPSPKGLKRPPSPSYSSTPTPTLKDLTHISPHSILRRIDLSAFATSTKIEALTQELLQMRQNSPGSKAIVFSQFINMLDLIRWRLHSDPFLSAAGLGKVAALQGHMNAKTRDATLKQFREDGDTRVLLISLKAGGVALNLTVANYIYLMDPWWNPAAEMQAIDRTHRMGQYRPIRAVRFIAEDTVEERILQLQEKKRLVFDGTVGRDASSLTMLSVDDMKCLFA